jgi:hypothetical protein
MLQIVAHRHGRSTCPRRRTLRAQCWACIAMIPGSLRQPAASDNPLIICMGVGRAGSIVIAAQPLLDAATLEQTIDCQSSDLTLRRAVSFVSLIYLASMRGGHAPAHERAAVRHAVASPEFSVTELWCRRGGNAGGRPDSPVGWLVTVVRTHSATATGQCARRSRGGSQNPSLHARR